MNNEIEYTAEEEEAFNVLTQQQEQQALERNRIEAHIADLVRQVRSEV